MRHLSLLALLAVLTACEFNPRAEASVQSARRFSELYAKERLHASSAGDDCLVLLVHAGTRMDDETVESIHYGAGPMAAYEGGVRQFMEDHHLRAVVYRDSDERFWMYGSITRNEARSMKPCR